MSSKNKKFATFKEQLDENNSSITGNDQVQDYISYLKTAPDYVVPEDASQFFSDILYQFENKETSEELGLEIFHTLRIFVRNPDFFAEFAEGDFLLKLPFNTTNSNYIHQILNIVHDVIQIDPTIINSPFGDEEHFVKIVKREPLKSLSLISAFAQKCFNFQYDGTICPWEMIDILYNEVEIFVDYDNTDIFKQYASLLLYIFNEYPIYRDYRVESYWNLFVSILSQVTDPTIIETTYNILCFLKDYFNPNYEDKNSRSKKKSRKYIAVIKNHNSKDIKRNLQYPPELPTQQILKHIRINSVVRGAVFKLLISYAMIDPQTLEDSKLIQILIHYSTKSLKASLILMTAAEDEGVAKMIVNNSNLWLDKKLPQAVDTLRLFMILFQHKRLQSKLVSDQKFIPFLNFITEDLQSDGVVAIIGSIINQGQVTQEVMTKLRNENFITTFLDVASQNDNELKVPSHTALEFIRTAMNFGIYSDFLPYIKWLSKLKDVDELKETVSIVAAELAKDEKCAKKMISLQFKDFYEQQFNDPSSSKVLRSNSKYFLKRIQRFQKRE